MLETFGFSIFVVVALVVVGSFALGTQWNIRKGDHALKWFHTGLPLIGEKTTMRWMGSSVLELKIQKAKDPFRNAETLVIFEPRDVLMWWALTRLRGRRDLLIFRAQLRTTPQFELEVFDPKAWRMDSLAREVLRKQWTRLELGSPDLRVFAANPGAAKIAQRLIERAQHTGGQLARFSLHRTVPNLEIHWRLPDLQITTAREWFFNLRQIGEESLKAQ